MRLLRGRLFAHLPATSPKLYLRRGRLFSVFFAQLFVPTLDSPAHGAIQGTARPVLTANAPTHYTSLHFHLQWDTANTFNTGNLQQFETKAATANWTHSTDGVTWNAFPTGGVASGKARYSFAADQTNNTFYWRMRCWNGTNYGHWSEIWALTLEATPVAPPNNIRAVPRHTEATIRLTNSPAATQLLDKYVYYRATTDLDGSYVEIGRTSTPGFTDTAVSPAVTYFYRLKVLDTWARLSDWSNTTSTALYRRLKSVTRTTNRNVRALRNVATLHYIPLGGELFLYASNDGGVTVDEITAVANRANYSFVFRTPAKELVFYAAGSAGCILEEYSAVPVYT